MSEETVLPHNHGENINVVLQDLPKNADFSAVSALFSSLADANRIKLFWFLCHMEECVINLSALMNMSSPALSHHLKILREKGLITSRRAGKEMYYKAANTEEVRLLHHMIELLIDITCPEKDQGEKTNP
ncbi:metalloregulator ArsR/SmtB family transcription factor [Acidaminococcus timonensis]|jgi:DNA-binding transcriptional ArsR family regulator|uniref:ArsR/SmtB family transcription factor n=1 Tax=Acidaminococcus TaxID=904 RepID=UPI0025D55657|nr:metalloregulator ArsR/SmtB family transcription factor [Acidaminococcus timonensis]MDD6570341.1 metalloregulator ArsR/SmtB family transcription factor [Acidaminococcus sp.]